MRGTVRTGRHPAESTNRGSKATVRRFSPSDGAPDR